MKHYNKKTILVYISLILIVDTIFILPTGRGITKEKTTSSIADKHTYIETANTISNQLSNKR